MKRIDMHAHVFNLHFLPVGGALRGIANAWLNIELPRWLCRAVANYFLNKTDEDGELVPYQLDSEADVYRLIEDILTNDSENIFELTDELRELYDFVRGDEHALMLEDIDVPDDAAVLGIDVNAGGNVAEVLKDTNVTGAIKQKVWKRLLIKFLVRRLRKQEQSTGKIAMLPLLSWINFMTSPYEKITRTMMDDEYPEIDLFVHHDMDMDDWYQRWGLGGSVFQYDLNVGFPAGTQVRRISELVKEPEFEGRIIPFYAYNPNKSLEMLKTAVNDFAYAGVKFYPPSGYLPMGNEHPPFNRADWDDRNRQLYRYCCEKGLPLFTHCNYEGMEAYYGAGANNNVRYWQEVLIEFPELRLCFGHAGGHEGWFTHPEDGNTQFLEKYSGMIWELCTRYPNVYCDFGYMPEISEQGGLIKLYERLMWCYENSAHADYPFADKIMYGSDFHLLMREHTFDHYYPKYKALYEKPGLREYADRFFNKNAVNYLNLQRYIDRNKGRVLSDEAISRLQMVQNNTEEPS